MLSFKLILFCLHYLNQISFYHFSFSPLFQKTEPRGQITPANRYALRRVSLQPVMTQCII